GRAAYPPLRRQDRGLRGEPGGGRQVGIQPGSAGQARWPAAQCKDGRRRHRGAPHRPRGPEAGGVVSNSGLHKATLQEVDRKPASPPKLVGDPIKVQLNPTSLRLALVNNVDVGKAMARPATQAQGSSSSTLSFDLVFDTADQDDNGQPVDVRSL